MIKLTLRRGVRKKDRHFMHSRIKQRPMHYKTEYLIGQNVKKQHLSCAPTDSYENVINLVYKIFLPFIKRNTICEFVC